MSAMQGPEPRPYPSTACSRLAAPWSSRFRLSRSRCLFAAAAVPICGSCSLDQHLHSPSHRLAHVLTGRARALRCPSFQSCSVPVPGRRHSVSSVGSLIATLTHQLFSCRAFAPRLATSAHPHGLPHFAIASGKSHCFERLATVPHLHRPSIVCAPERNLRLCHITNLV